MSLQEEAAPKWMIELEDKLKRMKERNQLGHEFGAGSRCLTCKNGCPGLDLHFWRKICIACKCKKEDHDVPDDGSSRFEILLNSTNSRSGILNMKIVGPYHNNVVLKQLSNKMFPTPKNIRFDWIPPNISNELAAEYMEQLPHSKIPMSGTEGAKYRKTQIERQIPLHDISFETSQELGPNEQRKFFEYLQNIRDNVVGQAKIQKLCQKQFLEKSEPYMNMPEAQRSGDIHKPEPLKDQVTENNDGEGTNLTMEENVKFQMKPAVLKLPSAFLPITKKSKVQPPGAFVKTIPPASTDDVKITNLNQLTLNGNESDTKILNNISEDELLNNVQLCQAKNEMVNINQLDSQKIDNLAESNDNPSQVPSSTIDNRLINGKQPHFDLRYQPGFDSHPSGYEPVPNSQKETTLQRGMGVIATTDETSQDHLLPVDKAMNCAQCDKEISFGSVAIVTDRAGPEIAWHPECFVCNTCQELLVDLIYFFHHGKVFCGRHYAEKMSIPRCHACDELIFVQEYTLAEENSYHVQHYCCIDCDLELAGENYVLVDDHPKCLQCFNKNYAKSCQTCKKKIKITEEGVKFGDLDWHATAECFKCVICDTCLLKRRISIKQGNALCSSECIIKFNARQS